MSAVVFDRLINSLQQARDVPTFEQLDELLKELSEANWSIFYNDERRAKFKASSVFELLTDSAAGRISRDRFKKLLIAAQRAKQDPNLAQDYF